MGKEQEVKFKTHNEDDIDINGTCLQGYINISFHTLVEVFGEPMEGCCDKTDAEWAIMFEDDTVASIYNYKDGINYCGTDGIPVEDIIDWHVGGFSSAAVEMVKKALL